MSLQSRLIDEWRSCWRLWSVWYHVATAALIAAYELIPAIPPEVAAIIPPTYRGFVLAGWAIFGLLLRLAKQKKSG